MDYPIAPRTARSDFTVENVAPPPLPALEDVPPPPLPPIDEVPPPPLPAVPDVAPPPVPSGQADTFEEVLDLVMKTRDLQRRLIVELTGRRASEIPGEMRERLITEVGLCRQLISFYDDWLHNSWTFRLKRNLP